MAPEDIRWKQRFQNFENSEEQIRKETCPALDKLYKFYISEGGLGQARLFD